MARYICYNETTGQIDHVRESDAARMQHHALPPGYAFVEWPNDDAPDMDALYVMIGDGQLVIAPRPTFAATDIVIASGSGATINVPVGTTVVLEGSVGQAIDGLIEVDGNMPGQYQLELSLWPHLPKTVTVTVE